MRRWAIAGERAFSVVSDSLFDMNRERTAARVIIQKHCCYCYLSLSVSVWCVCCFVINFVATAAVAAGAAAAARLFVLIMKFSLPTTQSLQDTRN
jgi:hypothetical protein